MRVPLLVLLLALAVGATVFWLGRAGELSPPTAPVADAPAAPPPAADPAAAAALERAAAPGEAPAAATAAPAATPPADAGRESLGEPPNLELHVRSAATKAPLAAFRWRFRSPASPARGDGAHGFAAAVLLPGASGELLVEADGFQPFVEPRCALPAAGAPPLRRDVFLTPSARATGIALQVRGPDGQPVPHLLVEAIELPPGADEAAAATLPPLWSRRAAAADGRYVLPELAPGRYAVRGLAVDPNGELLPVLPIQRSYTLTGSNSFLEDVVMEPGALPVVELRGADGQFLAPARTAVELRPTSGTAGPRRWLGRGDRGLVAALDAPPVAGPVWPAAAVPAGAYVLAVRVDGQLRVELPLSLQAGERQTVPVRVP